MKRDYLMLCAWRHALCSSATDNHTELKRQVSALFFNRQTLSCPLLMKLTSLNQMFRVRNRTEGIAVGPESG